MSTLRRRKLENDTPVRSLSHSGTRTLMTILPPWFQGGSARSQNTDRKLPGKNPLKAFPSSGEEHGSAKQGLVSPQETPSCTKHRAPPDKQITFETSVVRTEATQSLEDCRSSLSPPSFSRLEDVTLVIRATTVAVLL